MKKKYTTPIAEKVVFDYRVQTQASQGTCFESVMNVRANGTGEGTQIPIGECVDGNIIYIGWTTPQTGV